MLKNPLSPGVVVAVIVVVVVILGLVGWRYLGPGSRGGGDNPYDSRPNATAIPPGGTVRTGPAGSGGPTGGTPGTPR